MKNILITGANSYIGTSLGTWLAKYPDKYSAETVDMRVDLWKEKDFSKFDVIFHVAGIAHVRETRKNKDLYYKINCDLTYEVAKKAKVEGVKQFIFLSSMSVYGLINGIIDKNTPLNPDTNYGKSKLQAEELLEPLGDGIFKIAILRPPMVYGKGCKGNYQRLASLALKTPVFPDIDNKRSMIYIDNLCEFARLLIEGNSSGLFLPQNSEYVKTSKMIKLIAEIHGKKIKMIKLFNPILRILRISIVQKVFGDLIYDKSLSIYNKNYNICDFHRSIKLTEQQI